MVSSDSVSETFFQDGHVGRSNFISVNKIKLKSWYFWHAIILVKRRESRTELESCFNVHIVWFGCVPSSTRFQ